jgi:hypothetical protein
VTTAQVVMSSSSLTLGGRLIDNYENAGVMRNNAGGGMFNKFASVSMGSGEVAGNERVDGGARLARPSSSGAYESSPAFREQENGRSPTTLLTPTTSVPGP